MGIQKMKLRIVLFNGKEQVIECDSFEFRCNQVANWIRYKKDGNETMIHGLSVIDFKSDD